MVRNKAQVLLVHGGMTFCSRKDYIEFLQTRDISVKRKARWSDEYLDRALGGGFEIIRPRMPCQDNAKYIEWMIHFERHLPQLRDGIILIGRSLGATFLAKYLSENRFPRKILSLYLVCPPFDNTLHNEDLVGGFGLGADLSLIEKNCANVTLMFSKDDDVVPLSHADKFRTKLKSAKIIIYEHMQGHFQIQEFPEIVRMIRADVRHFRK